MSKVSPWCSIWTPESALLVSWREKLPLLPRCSSNVATSQIWLYKEAPISCLILYFPSRLSVSDCQSYLAVHDPMQHAYIHQSPLIPPPPTPRRIWIFSISDSTITIFTLVWLFTPSPRFYLNTWHYNVLLYLPTYSAAAFTCTYTHTCLTTRTIPIPRLTNLISHKSSSLSHSCLLPRHSLPVSCFICVSWKLRNGGLDLNIQCLHPV